MSFKSLLDSKITIKRESDTADGQGGFTTTLVTLYKRVPCRFESLPKEGTGHVYDKETVFPDYYIYLQFHSGIKEGDLVFLGSKRFEIMLVENWSERNGYQQLHVTEQRRDE